METTANYASTDFLLHAITNLQVQKGPVIAIHSGNAIGCNEQKISRANLAAIRCNKLNLPCQKLMSV